MDPAIRSSISLHFRLLDLPVELQRIIFGYALFTESTLRRESETRRYGDVVIFSGTNILRVSSQIEKETVPIFYQINHFHYEQVQEDIYQVPLDHVHHLPSIFFRPLHMMRHISIDPIQLQPDGGKREGGRGLYALEDRKLADMLVEIERHAPNLRTLALHFGPFAGKIVVYPPSLLGPIYRGNIIISVISALCRLRARVRLSLVYFGEPTTLAGFRSNIAPLEDWTARTLESWPVTIDPVLIKYINGWQDPEPSLRTRVWDICRCPGLHARDQNS